MSYLNTGTTNIPIPDSGYARWRRSTELCYLTAWQQMQPRDYRNPSDHDEMLNKEAVLMLTLITSPVMQALCVWVMIFATGVGMMLLVAGVFNVFNKDNE